MEITEAMWNLAALEGECPALKAALKANQEPPQSDDGGSEEPIIVMRRHERQCTCKDGRIPLLPGVRVPCEDEECQRTGGYVQWTGPPYLPEDDTQLVKHPECQGTTYTPSQEFEDYLEAAVHIGTVYLQSDDHADDWQARIIADQLPKRTFKWSYGKTAPEAFFAALTEALKPLACNWDEVERRMG